MYAGCCQCALQQAVGPIRSGPGQREGGGGKSEEGRVGVDVPRGRCDDRVAAEVT
jgi:hypothetical protein